MLNRETEESSFRARAIGDDGHYYECEECHIGGELLCCDRCPCTYHLECLNPSIEMVPEGEWLCPECARAKCFTHPNRTRSKRVVKKTVPTKSTAEDIQDFDKKKSSNLKLKLVFRNKWTIEPASSTAGCSVSPLRKRQNNPSESSQSLKKQNKNQEMFEKFAPPSTEGLEEPGLGGSGALFNDVIQE
ncbi:uncharacterized protein LOC144573659 [Carex rostrata]